MSPIELTVPMPPTLTNSGKGRSRHWRALEREKKAYWGELDVCLYTRTIPSKPPMPIDPAVIRSTMYMWSPMDDDNAVSRHKWLIDWLVWRNYLYSDRRKHLRWGAFPEQILERGERRNPRIVLTISPVPE